MHAHLRRALPRMRGRALLRQLLVETPASAAARSAESAEEPPPTRILSRLAALVDVRVDAPAEPTFRRADRRSATRPAANPAAARPLASR